ncbi:MAG: MoaD/ThiS family protein [Treponema sp.]|jgi:molybdopterin converting factor small subunit|nr:MoaD/ThiS family protein [Treponema sp.]
MTITVKLTGLLAGAAGFREKTMEITAGMTAGDVFSGLALPASGQWNRISVNNRLAAKSQELRDGDTILFFPIGGGG